MSSIEDIIVKWKHTHSEFDSLYYVIPIILWTHDVVDIHTYIRQYFRSDKINIILIVTDLCSEIQLENPERIIVLRTSLYKSKRLTNEYLLPYFWDCVPFAYPPLPKKASSSLPIIGFCGQNNRKERDDLIQYFSKRPDNFQTNFLLRSQFWGGAPHNEFLISQYNENMQSSHFIIASRGSGNFSMRFYQTLAAGRIPVLIDSDMIFPFENIIDWDRYIVRGSTAEEVGQRILDVWNSLTEEEWCRKQEEVRVLFDQYIRYDSFLDAFSRHVLFSVESEPVIGNT